MTVSDDARKTIAILEEHGWTKFRSHDLETGCYCMSAAMAEACRDDDPAISGVNAGRWEDLDRACIKVIWERWPERQVPSSAGYIPRFNDDDRTTYADVLAVLKTVAGDRP